MILHSRIYGSGSPILVFHGLFGNGENWIFFAREFENNYPIHLLDMRNHGKSFVILKKVDFNIIHTRKDLDHFLKIWISDLKIRSFFSKCTQQQKNGNIVFHFSLLNIIEH
ncbi:alpha/beta fold hydrolase [Blattabacterium cuenoti]|uniref:alpha/beta fold hydrolase n=1 Tax=Blattabacterium cuenoti TaxID=1653831 RepID=UPI0031204525